MKAYMKVKGIDGECTDKDHSKWINVTGFHHGLSQRTFGNAQGREQHSTGQVENRDFVVTKELDASSPNLNIFCCQNKKVEEIVLEVVTKANEKNNKTLVVTLKDAVISSVQLSGTSNNGATLPEETVAFRCSKMKWDYTPLKKDNSGGGTVSAEFDFKQNA